MVTRVRDFSRWERAFTDEVLLGKLPEVERAIVPLRTAFAFLSIADGGGRKFDPFARDPQRIFKGLVFGPEESSVGAWKELQLKVLSEDVHPALSGMPFFHDRPYRSVISPAFVHGLHLDYLIEYKVCPEYFAEPFKENSWLVNCRLSIEGVTTRDRMRSSSLLGVLPQFEARPGKVELDWIPRESLSLTAKERFSMELPVLGENVGRWSAREIKVDLKEGKVEAEHVDNVDPWLLRSSGPGAPPLEVHLPAHALLSKVSWSARGNFAGITEFWRDFVPGLHASLGGYRFANVNQVSFESDPGKNKASLTVSGRIGFNKSQGELLPEAFAESDCTTYSQIEIAYDQGRSRVEYVSCPASRLTIKNFPYLNEYSGYWTFRHHRSVPQGANPVNFPELGKAYIRLVDAKATIAIPRWNAFKIKQSALTLPIEWLDETGKGRTHFYGYTSNGPVTFEAKVKYFKDPEVEIRSIRAKSEGDVEIEAWPRGLNHSPVHVSLKGADGKSALFKRIGAYHVTFSSDPSRNRLRFTLQLGWDDFTGQCESGKKVTYDAGSDVAFVYSDALGLRVGDPKCD